MTTRGRAPLKPSTDRGRKVMAILNQQGLTLTTGAKVAGCSFQVLFNLVHRKDLPSFTVATLGKLTSRLRIPLDLLAPQLAEPKAS